MKLLKTLTLAAAAFTITAAPVLAEEFNATQKEEMGTIIESYLMENPETIINALEAYQAGEQERETKKFSENLGKYQEELLTTSPFEGNPDGDITVVEFFDYNCGYCKKAADDVIKLLEKDKNVKVIFKDIPILSPASNEASRWALAAEKQGKYYEYHMELMTSSSGGRNVAALEKAAKKVGLDIEQLRKDAESKEIRDEIEDNLRVSRALGINGTPAFIIGDELAPGYLGFDGLQSAIARVRDK